MNDVEVVTKCLERGWFEDFDIVGEDLAAKITEDVLQGRGYQFEPASGGFSYDLSQHLELLFAAASLIAQVLQLYYQLKAEQEAGKLNRRFREELLRLAEERVRSEDISIEMVAKLLIDVKSEADEIET